MPDIIKAQDQLDNAIFALDCVLDLLCGHNDAVQISSVGMFTILRRIAEDVGAARKLLED